MTEVVVETGYKPRTQQREIHDAVENHRFVVVVAHRRMGKTVAALNQLIHSALQCDKPDPRFAYIAPTYGQAKRVAWDYLVNFTRPLDAAHMPESIHDRLLNIIIQCKILLHGDTGSDIPYESTEL